MPQLKRHEKIDLVRQYLDREGLDNEPLQYDLDRLLDDPKVRGRVGELIATAMLGRRLHYRLNVCGGVDPGTCRRSRAASPPAT